VDLRPCSLPRAAEWVAGAGRAGAAPSLCPAPPACWGGGGRGEREWRGPQGRWGGGESWREGEGVEKEYDVWDPQLVVGIELEI
jgi:hypothetical protein